jgi:adenylate cyclase
MRLGWWDWRILALVPVALAVPAASRWIVASLPSVHKLELLAYDWHFGSLPAEKPDDRIVLVGMDDASLDQLPIERRSYPLPRRIHAQLIDDLRQAGARVVGFDVWFTHPVPLDDTIFAEAIKRHGRVVSGLLPDVHIVDQEELFSFTEPAPQLRPHTMASSLLLPVRFGKMRWFYPYTVDYKTAKRYLHFAAVLTSAYYGESGEQPLLRSRFHLGRINAPVGGEGEILIRFAGPPGTFQPVSYSEVYSGAWRLNRGEDFFRNKIVMVGVFNPLVDHHDTPLGDMQGLEIQANAVQTLLDGTWLRHWSVLENYLATTLLCLAVVASIWRLGLLGGLAAAVAIALGWLVATHQIFLRAGVWADMVEPHTAIAGTYVIAAALEARRVRRVFYRFMPSWVAEHMLRSSVDQAPETADQEVSVVFCDVRNYTTLSEKLPVNAIEEMLHRYFLAGEEAAQRLGTELDKFVGDEIMLYFQPKPGAEPHALRAVRWALAMQEAAVRISESGLAGKIGFQVGVGICTGPVRVGTVGARSRIQHTVIGDAVNTASRLQTATKELGRTIVIADSTMAQARDRVEAEPLGEVRVKGKQEPLRVYCPVRVIETGEARAIRIGGTEKQ